MGAVNELPGSFTISFWKMLGVLMPSLDILAGGFGFASGGNGPKSWKLFSPQNPGAWQKKFQMQCDLVSSLIITIP